MANLGKCRLIYYQYFFIQVDRSISACSFWIRLNTYQCCVICFAVILQAAMPLSGNWLVAWRLMTITLFKLLRLVYISVQCVNWHLNGTAKKLREARLPHNYERSAQVLDVVFYYKFCPMTMTAIEDFLFTHNHFENPQYIIDNENITLMTINEYNAIFCEPREKGMLYLLLNFRNAY